MLGAVLDGPISGEAQHLRRFVRYWRIRALAAALTVILLTGGAGFGPAPTVLADSAPFEYYPGLPQGTVGVSMPTIADELVLAGVTPDQVTFAMTLNGTPVPAVLDPDGSRISYQPTAPLPPGNYNVALHIAVGQWYADTTWSFGVVSGALATLPVPSPAAAFALAWINSYRAIAGLAPLAVAAPLTASAAAHAGFYVTNESRYGQAITLSVHDETATWPGFTGQSPSDRSTYFGLGYGGISEDMAFGSGAVGAVDGWMDSVYHRFAITDPSARYAGFAIASNSAIDPNQPATDLEVADAGVGPADPTEAIAYPASGQQNVPEAFPAGEVPDPLTAFSGGAYPAGYPITLQFGSPQAASVTVTGASLTDAAGHAVAFDLLDGATTPPSSAGNVAVSEMGMDVALIPQRPLQPATLYQVRVTGSVTDTAGAIHAFTRAWSFSTSAYLDPGDLSASDTGTGTIALTTSGDSSHAQVFIGGYSAAGLVHVNANTMTFKIPAGLGAAADLYVVQPDGQEESWPAFVGPGGGWTSPPGAPPAVPGLSPLSALTALGVQSSVIPGGSRTVLQTPAGKVVASFAPGDPVGYVRAPGTGLLQRVVFLNPPVSVGGAVYVPGPVAAAAGYAGVGASTTASNAPAGYTGPQVLTLTIGLPQYTADGAAASWSPDLGAPFIAPGGRTMMPLRALSYVFGLTSAEINWFGPNGLPQAGPVQEVDLTTPWGTTIKVTATQIIRSGPDGSPPVTIPLDSAGLLVINGRTFVPFRALGYAFGLDTNQISWTTSATSGAVTSVSFNWQVAP